MFQFGTDEDEQQDGLPASLLGTKPNSMPDFGLGAMLSQMPNPGAAAPAQGDPAQDAADQGGNDTPGTDKPDAAPADDSANGEWGKMLAQLYEAGKFKSGYLSKVFGSVDYASLSAESANTTMVWGIADIKRFEDDGGIHIGYMPGSLVRWGFVDWSKYGADENLSPETVMRNFLSSAMNSGN